MRNKAHLSFESFSRLLVSLLLFCGLYLPLVCAFDAGSALGTGLLCGAVCLIVLWTANTFLARRWIMVAIVVGLGLIQLLLPGKGLIGSGIEAVKAITLYINGAEVTTAVFAPQLALFLGASLALISYLFTHPAAGFVPATVCVVVMFYAAWSFSKSDYLWLSVPGLIALLLLVSRTSHRRGNVLEVLPVASVVVVLGMLLLPSGQTVIRPLYNAAMDLKQAIEDYLFFTDAREIFSIGNYGWYPMGNGLLGGPVEVSENPVLMVQSEEKLLLRGITKDEYTGRSWRDTSGGKRYLYVNPRWSRLRREVFLEDLPPLAARGTGGFLEEKAVNVQVQNTGTSTLLVPAYLRSFSASGDMVTYFNDAGELFITRNLQRGDRYTAFAPITEGGGTDLGALITAVSNNTADPDYESIVDRYTALPAHLESKLFDDAAKMAAGYDTVYDQVCAISRNLQKYYKFTLTPDTPPENQDFVTYFLYVGKEGYSTYFASAMAVLCRMNGIPARYVEGFECNPSIDGMCYVTERNAHAWVEVYFRGFGWVPFDPTPEERDNEDEKQENPPETPPEEPETTPPPPEDEPEEPEEPDEPDEPDNPKNKSNSWWLWLVAAALAALAVRIVLTAPDATAKKQASPMDKVMVYASACVQLLALRGITRKKSESAARFARRVDQMGVSREPLTQLLQMLSVSSYSRMGLSEKAVERAGYTWHEFRKEMPWLCRLRFALLCAFTKKGYRALETTLKKETVTSQYPAVTYKAPKGRGRRTVQYEGSPEDYIPPEGYVPPRARTAEEIAAEMRQQNGTVPPGVPPRRNDTPPALSQERRRRRG